MTVDKAYISSSWHISQTISYNSRPKQISTPTYVDIDENGVLRAVWITKSEVRG